jgi:acetolactate synthase I/III small subunit
MRHIISCIVKNRPGAIAGITDFFARQQINVHSLAVSETEGEETSRVTIVIEYDEKSPEALASRLAAVNHVVAVDDLDRAGFLDRELVLVKIVAKAEDLPRIMQICEVMHASVAAMGLNTMTLEMSGTEQKISAFIHMLQPFDIREYARSGRAAVAAGD